ncbi:GNAT family N-acetyltransferase [Streptomyces sp. B1I3]|uniref:GNAT family N-acetyltransferase n=1 Tax=Streptomyces sp. B1I3 TaxID=3042264 RepID=UPI00278259C3|nr:GNAT family N-acetyltransferase [Streptomyces sp. B1I3]MDQ0792403.1 RimJ/RimL family protein N-acetyltransferase [Streptomyces sp. B1I3]
MDDLTTDRLILHPLTAAEATAVEHGTAEGPPAGARWAPGYPSAGDRAAARRFLETCAGPGDSQPFGPYEIRRRADGVTIGGVGFHGRPDAAGQVTVGYGLVRSARGSGFASEALRALLAFARSQGVLAVNGDADLDNIGSHRVMVSAGMQVVAVDHRLKHYRVEWSPATHRP